MSVVGYGLGLLCVGLAVAIWCGAVAVGATRGVRDGEDSEPPQTACERLAGPEGPTTPGRPAAWK